MVRRPRLLRDDCPQESKQNPRQKGSRGSRNNPVELQQQKSQENKQRGWPRRKMRAASMKKYSAQPPDAAPVRCRWQTRRRSPRLAASWRSSQPHQRLDMKSLREQIEQMHFRDFVANLLVPVIPWFSLPTPSAPPDLAPESTDRRTNTQFPARPGSPASPPPLRQARPRRIKHHKIRLLRASSSENLPHARCAK